MRNKIDPTLQSLIDKLKRHSSLFRDDEDEEILKLLEPYNDIAIPLLAEGLKNQSDDYFYFRVNALRVLAISSDYRSILPVIRQIEIETEWIGHIFNLLRRGLKGKDKNTHKKVNEQLIKYLEEGPKNPEPFDPVTNEKSFPEFLKTFLEPKTLKKVKEAYMKSSRLSAERDRSVEHQTIIIEIIDTLSEFNGLQDSRLGALLSKYIKEYGFESFAAQHALAALSKINLPLAITHLSELSSSSQSQQDTTIKRTVGHEAGDGLEVFDFAIYAREPDNPTWKECPYYFKHEKGLVFFFARGREDAYQWFVGQASNNNAAIQLAIKYLERWIQNIDTLSVKEAPTGTYPRTHVADRYSECVRIIQQYFDFEKWGFEQVHISRIYEPPHQRPQIIYNSEWCRVKFSFRSRGEMHDQSDVLSILYGRLHAADKEDSILWNGEPHHCWHHISLALCFLDGMSIEEAAKALWNHPIIAEYNKSKEMQNISQPSKEAEMHTIIWEKYGHRLFELFDLRRPDLWDKYSVFIKEVYEIKGFKYYGHGVPREKIC